MRPTTIAWDGTGMIGVFLTAQLHKSEQLGVISEHLTTVYLDELVRVCLHAVRFKIESICCYEDPFAHTTAEIPCNSILCHLNEQAFL